MSTEQTTHDSEEITSADVGALTDALTPEFPAEPELVAPPPPEGVDPETTVPDDQMYWSPSKLSFYVQDVHGDNRPDDCIPYSREQHSQLMQQLSNPDTINTLVAGLEGQPKVEQTAHVVSADAYRKFLDHATSRWADQQARSKGYTDLATACSWASSGVPKFKAEGELFSKWRDAMWTDFTTKVEAMTDADLKRNSDNIQTFLDRLVQFNGFKG